MTTADPPGLSTEQIAEIAAAVAVILRHTDTTPENELRLYTPEDTAPLVGKTAYWLKKQAQRGLIPHCRVGQTVMFRAKHIRELQELTEYDPKARSRRRKPQAKNAA